MAELNPNHKVTQALHDQWHKLCAIVIWKFGVNEVSVTGQEIERFMESGIANITAREHLVVLTLALVTDGEAERLARREGGLVV